MDMQNKDQDGEWVRSALYKTKWPEVGSDLYGRILFAPDNGQAAMPAPAMPMPGRSAPMRLFFCSLVVCGFAAGLMMGSIANKKNATYSAAAYYQGGGTIMLSALAGTR